MLYLKKKQQSLWVLYIVSCFEKRKQRFLNWICSPQFISGEEVMEETDDLSPIQRAVFI